MGSPHIKYLRPIPVPRAWIEVADGFGRHPVAPGECFDDLIIGTTFFSDHCEITGLGCAPSSIFSKWTAPTRSRAVGELNTDQEPQRLAFES